jgi:uncharacterized membrane protein
MGNDLGVIAANFFTAPFRQLDVEDTETIARGINRDGIVVGVYRSKDLKRHGFRWNLQNDKVDTFDYPVSGKKVLKDTIAAGINNKGYIVGFYSTEDGEEHGYRLDPVAFRNTEGTYRVDPGEPHPPDNSFLDIDLQNEDENLNLIYRDQKKTDPGLKIGTHAQCISISNDGDYRIGGRIFVGTPFPDKSRNVRGFVLTGGDSAKAWKTYHRIDALAGNSILTEVYGINSSDDVVGVTGNEDQDGKPIPGDSQSFMQINAITTPYTQLYSFPVGAFFSRAMGITSGRQIVGQCMFDTKNPKPVTADGFGYVWDTVGMSWLDYITIFTPLDRPSLWSGQSKPAQSTYAHGINDLKMVVGQFKDADPPNRIHGFVLSLPVWDRWRSETLRPARGAFKFPT